MSPSEKRSKGMGKKIRRMRPSGGAYLKVVEQQFTLCYGMRLDSGTSPEQVHPHVSVALPDGSEGAMALHVINGSMKEIEAQLRQSVEAFFDIHRDSKR